MKKILFLLILTCAVSTFAQTPTPTPDALTLEKQRADRLQARYNDFANLARYEKANSEVKPPEKGENRVVFLGDSITDFWKLAEYFPNQPYINRGISGQTTPQMLLRMQPDVVAHKPKVLVFFAGTNDISANTGVESNEFIQGNIRSIVEIAHANGINVVLASIMPVSDYNKNSKGEAIIRTVQRPPARILELNKWIKSYCDEKGLVYLDYFSATVDDKGFLKAELANDGLHPNEQGYKIMQKLVAEAIAKALKKKQKGVK
ncbi:MAG TPA: SGNH/GDSL hydrolase family protein [Pyrinomonadaceae bacterium]|nr:SGNH/GDSL hydrolase family protein [Pyrinomonadaceae bacterium]